MNQDNVPRARVASYREAGVDIDAADLAKQRIANMIATTHGPEVVGASGLFGGLFQAPGDGNPCVLVSSADSVGTKILVANLVGRHRSIGVDIVHHCVNDILACGARPLFFLDYFATDGFEPTRFEEIVSGMTEACRGAGCALIGGETAQLPGIYRAGTYDLAGFIVGVVRHDSIVDGSAIRPGDVLVGLSSHGLHTNGFSLARSALGLTGDESKARDRLDAVPEWADRTLAELLLEPHHSYLPEVGPLLDSGLLRGMAHITGGGLAGNVGRIIPNGLEAVIDLNAWDVPPLFRMIQRAGGIDDAEMYRVFNMGIGFVLVIAERHAAGLVAELSGARVIGEVRPAEGAAHARLVGLPDTRRG